MYDNKFARQLHHCKKNSLRFSASSSMPKLSLLNAAKTAKMRTQGSVNISYAGCIPFLSLSPTLVVLSTAIRRRTHIQIGTMDMYGNIKEVFTQRHAVGTNNHYC